MKRRLTSLLTVWSLLLCAAAAALWVRSYWRPDHLARNPVDPERRQYRQDKVQSYAGRVCLQFLLFTNSADVFELRKWAQSAALHQAWRHDAKVLFGVPDASGRERNWPYLLIYGGEPVSGFIAVVPYWLVVALTGVLPAKAAATAVTSRRRRRRALAGQCVACGYDLRATPGRCPECGDGRVVVDDATRG